MNRLRLQVVFVGLVVVMMMGEGIYCASSDPVTKFAYETFTDPLNGQNSAKDGELVLVDTGGLAPAGSVFYHYPVQVHGFRVSFTYTITNRSAPFGHHRPDGIAFVFKYGGSIDVVGPGAGGLGYGSLNEGGGGLSNTVAIEIDSWPNPELNDPENSHVSIHSNGAGLNNANEDYRIGSAPNLYELNPLFNFGTQNVVIEYNPVLNGGTFTVTINDQIGFTFANISLDDYLSIDPTMGSSFIGITAASHGGSNATVETISVTRWDYTYLGYLDAANSEVEGIDTVVAGAGLNFIVQAHDQFGLVMSTNTTSSPSSVLHATLVEPNGKEYNATASYIGSGKYVFYINATISGNATVNVWFDDTPVGYGSYVLVVTPANPYPLNSYPFGFTSGVDSVAVAGVPGTFYVRLQDVYGNNITTNASDVVYATVTPTFETSYSLGIVAEYDPSLGYYKAYYNVTLEGNFTIAIFYGKDALKDNQRVIQVVPNEIYNSTSVLYNVPTTAVAGELQTALLQLKDVYGNNASNAIANFTVEITQGSTVVSGAVGNCVRGLCLVTYTLTVASYNSDQYTLVVLVNDNAVLNSSTTLGVIPAALTPSVSYAYGDGISKSRAGDYASFYVQLTDVFGNNFTSPAPPVTAELASDSGDSIVPTQVSASLGLYTFQYNATKATTYSLTILVNASAISNGVPTVTVSPTDIDAATSIAFGSGVSDNLVVGVNNVFYVQLRDIFSNNITQQGGEVKAKIENDALSVYATSSFDEQQGVYVLSYNITLAAAYTVTITLVDAPIMNSVLPITLQPGDIYPLQCQAFGVEPGVIAGELNQIYIQLRDVYANDITSVPAPNNITSAQFVGSNTSTGVDVVYSGTGQYVLSYNSTLSGHYNLTIWVLGSAISGGGFYFVEVIPAAAYPPLCIVEGNNVATTVAGAKSLFQVYLFDVFNNSIAQPSPADTPIVTIDQQVVSVDFNAAINAYDASFNITQSGSFGVAVSINGTQILSSAIQVATAPLDVANSNTSDPITVPAGANAGFYIYQRDRFDNLIQDYSQVQSIYVLLELGGDEIKMTPQQTTLGAYELNFNLTVSGPYSTSVFINDQLVYGNTFTTDITPGPYDPAGTITVGLQTNVTAGDLNVFNIQLKDIFGNDVTENYIIPAEINVRLNGTSIPIVITILNITVFQVAYNYTTAGTYWMNITINGTDVGADPPGFLIIQASEVYPPACYAEGLALSQAVVKKPSSFTVVVKDRYNNHHMWSTNPPKVTLTSPGQVSVDGTITTAADGTYNVSYQANAKATYSMTITLDGTNIKGSPFQVQTNYGNNSTSTIIIICSVVGGVLVVAAIVGGIVIYRRRQFGYAYLR